jgi:hypothetical protein
MLRTLIVSAACEVFLLACLQNRRTTLCDIQSVAWDLAGICDSTVVYQYQPSITLLPQTTLRYLGEYIWNIDFCRVRVGVGPSITNIFYQSQITIDVSIFALSLFWSILG